MVAASLCSIVPERGHAAPDEAALNDLAKSNFAPSRSVNGMAGRIPPRAVAAPRHWAVLAVFLKNFRLKSDNICTEPRFGLYGTAVHCLRGERSVRTKFKSRLVAIALISCAVCVATWFTVQWWPQYLPDDFEQCSEKAQTTASSKDEQISLIGQCDKQFVGRRKVGGGYTYYDFLQNRHFDIAGPNPTPNELKHFDEEYTLYLETQRRDAVAAAIAEKQSRASQPDYQDDRVTGSISPPGLPMIIAPTNVPVPRARSSVVRSKGPCEDASLSCSWTKFSAGIKTFFESNAKVNRP